MKRLSWGAALPAALVAFGMLVTGLPAHAQYFGGPPVYMPGVPMYGAPMVISPYGMMPMGYGYASPYGGAMWQGYNAFGPSGPGGYGQNGPYGAYNGYGYQNGYYGNTGYPPGYGPGAAGSDNYNQNAGYPQGYGSEQAQAAAASMVGAGTVAVQPQNNGTVILSFTGNTYGARSVRLAVLNSKGQETSAVTVTRPPAQSQLKMGVGSKFYRVTVHYSDGSTAQYTGLLR